MAMVTSSIRDASFSSYLSTNEENFVCKLNDQKSSGQNLSPIITTSKGDQHKHLGARKNSKKEEEEEIGVFGAEKYFNGVMDEDSSKSSSSTCSSRKFHVSQQRDNLDHMKLKVQPPGTPSVLSESSWNSQSALLRNHSRNPKRTNKSSSNKAQRRKGFFATLGCSCTDKDSVEVNEVGEISFKKNGAAGKCEITTPHIKQSPDLVAEALVKIKQTPDSWVKEEILINKEKIEKLGSGLSRENCFTFPAPNPGAVTSSNLPIKIPTFQEMEDEKVRKSIEVFGSPVLEKRKKALGLEKRLTVLSWDTENPSGGTYAHESDSDASSDLFEIESLTGKNNPFLARQASDGCATPTNYAPSEASIEWSVATASAVDFSSAMSDCEDLVRARSPTTNTTSAKGMVPIRHRPTVLLGCKSQKAVKVAANAHRPYNNNNNNNNNNNQKSRVMDPKLMPRKPEMPFMPSTRFQAETTSKLTGFDNRVQGQHALAPRPLSREHSPHASHLLFMQ